MHEVRGKWKVREVEVQEKEVLNEEWWVKEDFSDRFRWEQWMTVHW